MYIMILGIYQPENVQAQWRFSSPPGHRSAQDWPFGRYPATQVPWEVSGLFVVSDPVWVNFITTSLFSEPWES